MRVPKVVNALNYLDDDLISDAINYMPKKRPLFQWSKWKAVAACLLIMAVVGGTILHFNKPGGSPLVLTAYAMENQNTFTSIMREGESVPVSLFESKSGWKGFVFSYVIGDSLHPSAISIIPESKFRVRLDEIGGLPGENGRHYYYFIPDQSESAPYSFTFSYTDIESNTIYEYVILIDDTGNGYNAVIESITIQKE